MRTNQYTIINYLNSISGFFSASACARRHNVMLLHKMGNKFGKYFRATKNNCQFLLIYSLEYCETHCTVPHVFADLRANMRPTMAMYPCLFSSLPCLLALALFWLMIWN